MKKQIKKSRNWTVFLIKSDEKCKRKLIPHIDIKKVPIEKTATDVIGLVLDYIRKNNCIIDISEGFSGFYIDETKPLPTKISFNVDWFTSHLNWVRDKDIKLRYHKKDGLKKEE